MQAYRDRWACTAGWHAQRCMQEAHHRRDWEARGPTKGPNAQPDGNMGAVQSEGVFLGYNRSSNTFILGSGSERFESRSVSRRPEQNRWSAERIGEIAMTPWSTREKAEQIVRFEDAAASGTPVETAPISAPRKFRINPADLAAHGYTERCAQCRHIETVGRARPGGTHSDACRKRIIEAIGVTEAGRQRLADYVETLDRAMVEFSHLADTAGETAPPPSKVEPDDTADADADRADTEPKDSEHRSMEGVLCATPE